MGKGYACINVDDTEDVAPGYGMGEAGECRLLTGPLGGEGIGASFYRINAGKRHGFGHHHDAAEEMYFVARGSGRVEIDDEILELRENDVVRCAPPQVREFEGGPDGMELLAFGHRIEGDGEMVQGFWPQDDAPAA